MMFARHQFELSKPASDGVLIREHLELVYERTGELPAELANAPQCPSSASQIWADFLELHTSRQSTGFGPAPITWRDMADWQTMREVKLSQWDIDQIRALDSMWLNEFAPTGKEEGQSQ
jgi:hypothetical protein